MVLVAKRNENICLSEDFKVTPNVFLNVKGILSLRHEQFYLHYLAIRILEI